MQANYAAESTLVSYHSKYCSDTNVVSACGLGVTDLKTDFAGPAGKMTNKDEEDCIDEALSFFRAQVLFKNFEVKGPSDKTLIYLTCFI